jgi:SAM-dependent methyltransferase
MMHSLAWAFSSVREHGWKRTVKVATSVVADLSFDLRYGTDTMRRVEVADLGAVGSNQHHSVHYQASRAKPLQRLLNSLNLPRDGVFVDLGCGKGRALLVAAECGFEHIVGVEFSPRLCECARQNVKTFKRRSGITAEIDIVLSDVADYRVQEAQCVFFMYNPFDDVVMNKVLSNIRRSVVFARRTVWLLYNTPRYHDLVTQDGLFRFLSSYHTNGTEFNVYTTC